MVEQLSAVSLMEAMETQKRSMNFIAFVFKNEDCFSGIDLEMNTGFDLKNLKNVVLKKGDKKIVQSGMKWIAPVGFYLSIVPRSGISHNTPIVISNAPATIESSYRGDISLLLKLDNDYLSSDVTKWMNYKGIEIGNDSVFIPKYTRLTQCIIHKTIFAKNHVNNVYYCIDEELYNVWEDVCPSVRGADGFGSTGTK